MAMTEKQIKVLRELYDALFRADNVLNPEGTSLIDLIIIRSGLKRKDVTDFMNAVTEMVDDLPTYEVVKFYRDANIAAEVIFTGLEKEEAKGHCRGDDSFGEDWFYGFREE